MKFYNESMNFISFPSNIVSNLGQYYKFRPAPRKGCTRYLVSHCWCGLRSDYWFIRSCRGGAARSPAALSITCLQYGNNNPPTGVYVCVHPKARQSYAPRRFSGSSVANASNSKHSAPETKQNILV